jgi:hypothetical protein
MKGKTKLEIQQITIVDIIHKNNINNVLERVNKEFKNKLQFEVIFQNKNNIINELESGKAIRLLTHNFGKKEKNSLTLDIVQGIYPINFIIIEMRFIEKNYFDKEHENGYNEIILFSKSPRKAHHKYEEVDKKIDKIRKQQLSKFKNLFDLMEFQGEGSCIDFYVTRNKELFDQFSENIIKLNTNKYTYREGNNYHLRGLHYDEKNNDTLIAFQNGIYRICYILLYDKLYKSKIENIVKIYEFKYKEAREKKKSFKYFHSLLEEKFIGNIAKWENVFSNDIIDYINEISISLYKRNDVSEYHSLLDNLVENSQKHHNNVITKLNRLTKEINAYINHIKIIEDRRSQRASNILSSIAVLVAVCAIIFTNDFHLFKIILKFVLNLF